MKDSEAGTIEGDGVLSQHDIPCDTPSDSSNHLKGAINKATLSIAKKRNVYKYKLSAVDKATQTD